MLDKTYPLRRYVSFIIYSLVIQSIVWVSLQDLEDITVELLNSYEAFSSFGLAQKQFFGVLLGLIFIQFLYFRNINWSKRGEIIGFFLTALVSVLTTAIIYLF